MVWEILFCRPKPKRAIYQMAALDTKKAALGTDNTQEIHKACKTRGTGRDILETI